MSDLRERVIRALSNAYWKKPGPVRWEVLADAVITELRKDLK